MAGLPTISLFLFPAVPYNKINATGNQTYVVCLSAFPKQRLLNHLYVGQVMVKGEQTKQNSTNLIKASTLWSLLFKKQRAHWWIEQYSTQAQQRTRAFWYEFESLQPLRFQRATADCRPKNPLPQQAAFCLSLRPLPPFVVLWGMCIEKYGHLYTKVTYRILTHPEDSAIKKLNRNACLELLLSAVRDKATINPERFIFVHTVRVFEILINIRGKIEVWMCESE